MIARLSGILLQFTMPSMTLDNRYVIPQKTSLLELNLDGSRVAVIDAAGILRLLQLEFNSGSLIGGLVGSQSRSPLTKVHPFLFKRLD